MAAVSTYTNGRGYGAHRQEEEHGQDWDFSEPVQAQNKSSNTQRFAQNQESSQSFAFNPPSHPKTPPRSDFTVSNGASSGQLKSEETFDPSYLSPKRSLRPGFSESRSGSEADSLLDLYGHSRSLGERSAANSMDRDRGQPQEEVFLDDEDPEHSRWIHRDKLAMIESRELRTAGVELPRPQTSSSSRSKSRRKPSQDIPSVPNLEQDAISHGERKKRRTHSPIRQDNNDETFVNEDFDLRTPEEIAAEREEPNVSSDVYRQPDLRKSSSRIPLPRSSPMPIPQEHIERDTPLPRKRGASGNWTGEENGISYNRMRSRGNSVGSQVLLDDADTTYNTPTPASRPVSRDSPIKSRLPSGKPTHSRKPSLNTNTAPNPPPKSRQASASTPSPRTPSSTQRPKSRSGLEPRPSTAVNRPEGDPPWLATMYKPDPRLPPDQQLLPTHAKRLQQEQWAQAQKDSDQRRGVENKAEPQLPREFSPLAEHTVNGLQPSSREADEKTLQDNKPQSQWPLGVASSKSPQKSMQKGNRDASPITALPDVSVPHGGYSAIPRVKQQGESPVSPLPMGMGSGGGQRPLDPFEKERLAREGGDVEKEEKEKENKKEKGCGCCIVM
ncbi:hypothetical protein ACLMJK_008739 [Lecanora helva]